MVRIYAVRVHRFGPAQLPVLDFATEQARRELLPRLCSGDLILCVGAISEEMPVVQRGRLLGLVEPGVSDAGIRGFDEDPAALPIVRAWVFEPQLLLLDVLHEQLTFEGEHRVVSLEEGDVRTVLALPRVEVRVPGSPHNPRANSSLANAKPTTGPIPSSWIGTTSRDPSRQAWTYLMRFGSRELWKIGHTQNLEARLTELNQHVPHEVLDERWTLFMSQQWPSSVYAYEMEQRVLRALATFRSLGERVRCSREAVLGVWQEVSSELVGELGPGE